VTPKRKSKPQKKKIAVTNWWHQFLNTTSWFDRLGLLLIFGLSLRTILDPDFGWHLRSGSDFLNSWIIPKLDPYSHSLPSWPWVNHEWLSDVIVAFIHNYLGAVLLMILFAGLITAIFLIATSIEKVALPYRILAGLIGLLAALPILGVRMQMITLLGMASLLVILYRYRRGELKHLWIVPIIFLIWANLHGGFTIGLVILAVFWLCEGAKQLLMGLRPTWYKKLRITELTLSWSQLKHLLGIGLLSGIATLINPYGLGLYYDFYKLFINPFAIQHIGEWQPVSLGSAISYNFAIYLVLFGLILLLTYRKVEPTRWVLSGLFLYLSLLYWRNMPFFMIMSIGFLAEILQAHTNLVISGLNKNRWIMIGTTAIVGVLLFQRVGDVSASLIDSTKSFRAGGYPIDAVQWIKANPDKVGQTMFNEYDWGGFLVWKLPDYKVFVDGRMPFWQTTDRFPFFEEEYTISAQKGAIEMLEQTYGVDWMIIRPNRPLGLVLSDQKSWEKVYYDKYAVIYRKIDSSNETNN